MRNWTCEYEACVTLTPRTFCDEHACSIARCRYARMPGTAFCIDHECFRCSQAAALGASLDSSASIELAICAGNVDLCTQCSTRIISLRARRGEVRQEQLAWQRALVRAHRVATQRVCDNERAADRAAQRRAFCSASLPHSPV